MTRGAREQSLQLGGGSLGMQPPQRADGVIPEIVGDHEQPDERGDRARRPVAHQQLHRLDANGLVGVLELADEMFLGVDVVVVHEHP